MNKRPIFTHKREDSNNIPIDTNRNIRGKEPNPFLNNIRENNINNHNANTSNNEILHRNTVDIDDNKHTSTDMRQLEKLKNKIKDLEVKLGEINNGTFLLYNI